MLSYGGNGRGIHADLTAGRVRGQGRDTVVPGVFELLGTRHRDVLDGDNRANRLDGAGGDDLVVGGGGRDTLVGAGGDDILEVGGNGPTVEYGGPGNDTFRGSDGALVSFADSPVGVSLDLAAGRATGAGTDRLVPSQATSGWVVEGSAHDDTITGTPYDDSIDPGPGNDVVDAGEGADAVTEADVSGSGDDRLSGGAGDDRILVRGGDDVVDGGDGMDAVTYTDDLDRSAANAVNVESAHVHGLADGDSIQGNLSQVAWELHSTGFATRLDLSTGVLELGADDATVTGTPVWRLTDWGRTFITGSAGPDSVFFDAAGHSKGLDVNLLGGDDTLTGSYTNALVDLGAGDDTVSGDVSDSALDGGPGHDTVAIDGRIDQCDNFEVGTCNES